MSILDYSIAPCTLRFFKDNIPVKNEKHINLDEYEYILIEIKKWNLAGFVLTGYDFRIEQQSLLFRITCETARKPLVKTFDFKQKSINIFNENSRFLIWRPVKQNSESDIGWYILRGVSLEMREQILARFSDDDTIEIMSINKDSSEENQDDDSEIEELIYIASTKMNFEYGY